LTNTEFQTVFYHIGLEPKHRATLCIGNLKFGEMEFGEMKRNETRRIGAILHAFASRGFVSVSCAFLLYSLQL